MLNFIFKLFTLLYADDTVLMANDPSDLQNCLNTFAEYCLQWKLAINIEKTKIVIFGTRGKSKLNFKIGEETIEIANSYKYLGVLFSQSGSFLGARKHVVQQAKKTMFLLFTRINNLDIPIDLQLKLFDNIVIPILTYGSEIWGFENLDIIEKVHNDFIRKITRSKKSTPLYMLLGELGRYPVEIAIKARMIGFWDGLIHGKFSKLSFWLYQCLMHSKTRSKWLLHIQHIFETLGRPAIWQYQQNFHMNNLSAFVKSLLIDQYLQGWQNKSTQSSKALTYFSFKSDYAMENYFVSLPRKHYLNLFKFRTGIITSYRLKSVDGKELPLMKENAPSVI